MHMEEEKVPWEGRGRVHLTVTVSQWHHCAETSSDASDARDMTPHSPVHGHCWEHTLSLTQSNGRFLLLPKPWLHLSTGVLL